MNKELLSSNNIFISYSHEDEFWKDRLVAHLTILELEGHCSLWDDRKINAGENWSQEIANALDKANVAVIMISADFLTSKFIREKEIPRILERHENKGLHIIPLIVKPCAWDNIDWLSKLQARPKDGRALSGGDAHQIETDLANIAKEIKELLEKKSKPTIESNSVAQYPEKIFLSRLPPTNKDLFGREQPLAILNQAWRDPHIHILTVVAWGGVGKTALVNEWLNHLENGNYFGANLVYGWSFYSQGTNEDRQVSGDEFLADALSWFGDPDPSQGSSWNKGVRLAELIRRQKTLLILDGLEPLQYPPGEMRGYLKDQGVQALLKELAHYNQGLCVITTRSSVKDIEQAVGRSVIRVNLEHLSSEAGAQVLRNLGVQGTPAELREAVMEFKGHALALNLLGSFLTVVHEGDVRKRGLIPAITEDEEQGGHARRIMESYEKWLRGKPELNILYLMGLFDRPAQEGAINALRAQPVIEGLTGQLERITSYNWMFAIKRLRELRLLSVRDDTQPNTLDCHPLVREHFGKKLLKNNSKAWREANARLYEYYKNLPIKHLPETLEEMAPLLAAVTHGCQAGMYKESFEDIFIARINRGHRSFLPDKFGAVNSELALLSQFFVHPWEEVVDELTKDQQAFILSQTGLRLGLLGRHKEAEKPLQNGLARYEMNESWGKAANTARHLSRYYLTQGDLSVAEKIAQMAVDYAKKMNEPFDLMETLSTLGEVLHYTGRLQEAKQSFEIAEHNQKLSKPQFPRLSRLHGFRYFELLLSLGMYEKVIEYAIQTIEWPEQQDFLVGRALHRVMLGRAYLYQALRHNSKDFFKASLTLEESLVELREANQLRHIPSGLLAMATLRRLQMNFPEAWENLKETEEIANRANLAIHLTDYHIEAAHLCIAEAEYDSADEHLNSAMKMIESTGYKRREPEYYLQFARICLRNKDIENARKHLSRSKELVASREYYCLTMEIKEVEDQLLTSL